MKSFRAFLFMLLSLGAIGSSRAKASECFQATVAVQPAARKFLKSHAPVQSLQLKFEEQKCSDCTTVLSGTLSLSGKKIVIADICTMQTNPIVCGIVDDGGGFKVSVSTDGETAVISDYASAAGEIETVKHCPDARCVTLDPAKILTTTSVSLKKAQCH